MKLEQRAATASLGLLEHEDPASVAHLDDLGLEGRVLRTAENAIGGIDRSVAA